MPEKPRYIFILTTGHSGGTLLNLLLGASPAIFAAGESLRLWTLGTIDRQSEDTRDFWGTAAEALATQGWTAKDLERQRVEEAPMDLWRAWTTIISDQARGHIIADKSLSFEIIRKICEANLVDPFFVHLIRDPRGVDYSYRRKYGRNWRTAVTWQKSHFAIERFLRGKSNKIRLRYEDLCAFPDVQMLSVLRAAGEHFATDLLNGYPDMLSERPMSDAVFENTIYAGNRMRHGENRDGQTISADMEYLQTLPQYDWVRTSGICMLGLLRYGYPTGRIVPSLSEI